MQLPLYPLTGLIKLQRSLSTVTFRAKTPVQTTPEGDNVYLSKNATQILLRHRTVPQQVSVGYPQLLEASFHAITLALLNGDRREGTLITNAQNEIRRMLMGQWPDGRIPHLRFDMNPAVQKTQRPNAADWGTGPMESSGLTQLPLPATAVKTIFDASQDIGFVKEVYPKLLRYHEWLKNSRDVENNGLLVAVHPWETGDAQLPAWMSLLQDLHKSGQFEEVTMTLAEPMDAEQNVLWGLVNAFKHMEWDKDRIVRESPFQVWDPGLNSLWAKANEDLAALALLLGNKEDADRLKSWAMQTKEAVRNRLWSAQDRFFYPYDRVSNRLIPVKTGSGLIPLFASIPSAKMAAFLVRAINNPSQFKGPHGIPETPFQESQSPQGPSVRMTTQWLISEGLQNYHYSREANFLAEQVRDLVSRSGYWETYDAVSGEGKGLKDYSPSVLADAMRVDQQSVWTGRLARLYGNCLASVSDWFSR